MTVRNESMRTLSTYLSLLIVAVAFMPIFSASAQSHHVSYEEIRNYVLNGDSLGLNMHLVDKNFVKHRSRAWVMDTSLVHDSIPENELLITKIMSQKPPYLHYFNIHEPSIQRHLYFLFDIKDVHYYMKEAIRYVNKNKVKTYVWAYNELKDEDDEETIFILSPVNAKEEEQMEVELILYHDRALLIAKYHQIKVKD